MSLPLNLVAIMALLPASLLPAQNKAENSGVDVTRTHNLDEFNALEASDPNDAPGGFGIPGKYMNYNVLKGLKQEDFAGMDYDDVRLKTAWIRAVPASFSTTFDPDDLQGEWTAEYFRTTSEPHWGYAYLDLMHRGEAVVPHVIKLAEEIRGSPEEMWLITALPLRFGEKYRAMSVEFCRNYIRDRPRSPYMIRAVTYLENWGGSQDAELMRWIGSIRPRYTKWMEESVGRLLKRLANEAANPNKVRADPTKRPPFVKKNSERISTQSSSGTICGHSGQRAFYIKAAEHHRGIDRGSWWPAMVVDQAAFVNVGQVHESVSHERVRREWH